MNKKKALIISTMSCVILYCGLWFYSSHKVKKEFTNQYLAQEVKVSGFPLAQNIEAKGIKFTGMQGHGKILENVMVSQLSVQHKIGSNEYIVDTSQPIILNDEKANLSFKIQCSPDAKIKIVDNDTTFSLDYEGSGYTITTTNNANQKFFIYEVINPRINLNLSKNNITFVSTDSGHKMIDDKGNMMYAGESSSFDLKVAISDNEDVGVNFAMNINDYINGADSSYILEVLGYQQAQAISMIAPDLKSSEDKSNFVALGEINLHKNPEGAMIYLLPKEQIAQLDPKLRPYYQKPAPKFNVNVALDRLEYSNADYTIAFNGNIVSDLEDPFPSGKMTMKIDGFTKFVADINALMQETKNINAALVQEQQSQVEVVEKEENKIEDYARSLGAKNPASTADSLVFDLLKPKGSQLSFSINQVDVSQIMEDIRQLDQ